MSTAVAPRAVHRSNARYILMLGTMTALPAIATDIYLPALPEVARDLGTTATAVQLTMTATLIGGAFGQLVIGPLSDKLGRRTPVLIGVSLHIVTSVLCAMAPGIGSLIALRALQGFFNASATVVAMAIIRDRFVGSDASRLISRLMLVIGVAPLLAPSVGGLIAGQYGWRAVFVGLALYGVALWLIVFLRLPETLPPERRRAGGLRSALGGYRSLLHDGHFVALAVLPGLAMAVLFAYVVGSPFVLREQYGLSAQQFALLFAVNGIGLVAGAQVNAALVQRVAPVRILRVALPALLALAIALVVVVLTGLGGLAGILGVLFLLLSVINLVAPNASALALSRHGEVAGTAAAFMGCLQAGVAGAVSPLVGVFGGDARAMAVVMAGGSAVAVVVLVAATPAYRRGGWHLTERGAQSAPTRATAD